MIRIYTVCLFLVCDAATLAFGQEKKLQPAEVPAAVRAAVTNHFPDARVSGWSQEVVEGKNTYEVTVRDHSGQRDAVLAEDGSLLAIEETIPVAALPTLVKNTIAAKYPKAVLRKAEKISHDGQIDYEVDLARANRKEVTLSASGKIVKEE